MNTYVHMYRYRDVRKYVKMYIHTSTYINTYVRTQYVDTFREASLSNRNRMGNKSQTKKYTSSPQHLCYNDCMYIIVDHPEIYKFDQQSNRSVHKISS